jgi:phospholipid/cholesterol/gamma-HCH transport system substrate-binding protein
MNNLNLIVNENRGQVANTLGSIQHTSQEIQALSKNLETSVKQLNTGLDAVNTAQLGKNIDVLMTNAKETSENLKQISENLNNPTILLTVQQTLDSARATFENAQKITADVEQLTGDPAFRNNLRKLVDGLGSLVSSTESLEKQVYVTKVLESASSQLKYQIDVQQRLATFQAEVLAVTPANSESPTNPLISIEKNATPVFLAQPYLKPSPHSVGDRKPSKIN